MADTHTRNDLDQLVELLEDVRFTMFTTRVDGRLRSRPMTTLEADTSGSLWFFISADATTLDQIAADPSVGLAYADNGKGTYVSVAGDAVVRDDRAKVRELWNPAFKAWFEGPGRPEPQPRRGPHPRGRVLGWAGQPDRPAHRHRRGRRDRRRVRRRRARRDRHAGHRQRPLTSPAGGRAVRRGTGPARPP